MEELKFLVLLKNALETFSRSQLFWYEYPKYDRTLCLHYPIAARGCYISIAVEQKYLFCSTFTDSFHCAHEVLLDHGHSNQQAT